MDWIDTFKKDFLKDEDLNHLKNNKFCGSVSLNFSAGRVLSCDFKQHKSFSIATPNSFAFTSYEQTARKVPVSK
jgi:hypothetical protein